ncbi:hypothetical protein FIBSPDRAFT_198471 [Athelia psychrophila]|uniref:Uncharacterized protein n=1 Tax=Athelia psychrophila TaxID=1759441 RepID=A0A165ZRH4_9AGAM|nr:hypothetical protein FIBSPDRAFT_198471 [Fibularhizoctonia sp. CBS 109695]
MHGPERVGGWNTCREWCARSHLALVQAKDIIYIPADQIDERVPPALIYEYPINPAPVPLSQTLSDATSH